MKWLKNESDEMNLLKDNKLSFVMVAPAAANWNDKATEAAHMLADMDGADAKVACVDPSVNPDFCEAHEVMHQFTLLVFKGDHEVDRRRINTLTDLRKTLCRNLILENAVQSEPRRVRMCEAELALGFSA